MLITMPASATKGELKEKIQSGLLVPNDGVDSLIETLVKYGFWTDFEAGLTLGEQQWLEVQWEDALEFHLATSDMIWSRDYPENPTVMTRYHVDKQVEPDGPPPSTVEPAVEAVFRLPPPVVPDEAYSDVLRRRRTNRDFRGTHITLEDLSSLLAVTLSRRIPLHAPRSYCTSTYAGGAPFLGYLIIGGEGAPDELGSDYGIYFYRAASHELCRLRRVPELKRLDGVLWRQSYANYAPAMLVICADWRQVGYKYRFGRAYRFAFIECGQFMQTAVLVATALGLRAFQTPAIDDERMCKLLGVEDCEHGPVYVATFGRPA